LSSLRFVRLFDFRDDDPHAVLPRNVEGRLTREWGSRRQAYCPDGDSERVLGTSVSPERAIDEVGVDRERLTPRVRASGFARR
jgi:hypothetical protein